ncbi:hypothetical protein GCM10023100_02300 [Actinocorallia cavernae]|uniref:Uncharacterized protein n=2 Tax=Actinomycetes TaxID=1760 RepID=A0ABP8S6M9_9ACTN
MHGVGHQLFRTFQHPAAGQPVVQTPVGQDVTVEDGVPQHGTRTRVRAPRLLVTRRCEAQLVGIVIPGECVKDRCFVVIRPHTRAVFPRPRATYPPFRPHEYARGRPEARRRGGSETRRRPGRTAPR